MQQRTINYMGFTVTLRIGKDASPGVVVYVKSARDHNPTNRGQLLFSARDLVDALLNVRDLINTELKG